MSECERWIIYPLLFFALGAALRDKFLQHVTTKEVVATKIICQELAITDPKKTDRTVAKLTSGVPEGPQAQQNPNPFGVLYLYDSEGKELCGVTNQVLQVREINCLALKVIDPDNPTRALAALTSAAAAPSKPGGLPRRFGILALNNEKFGRLVGVPPAEPGDEPAAGAAPAPETTPADAKPESAGAAEAESAPAADENN